MSAIHMFSPASCFSYPWFIDDESEALKRENLPKVTQLVHFRPVLIAFIAVEILQIARLAWFSG